MKRRSIAGGLLLLSVLVLAPASSAGLSADLAKKLDEAKYVYIASTRKDASLGKPAEIWFFSHDGAIYVGTPPKSWRVRRIKAGRPQAKIWIGEPDGPSRFTATEREIAHLPSFAARGELVNDPKLQETLYEVFAKKYGSRWNDHESDFRSGFKDGSRVMVKYVPVE